MLTIFKKIDYCYKHIHRLFINLFFIFFPILFLSCLTAPSKIVSPNLYNESKTQEIFLSEKNNVNGTMPKELYINTLSQTFTSEYQFILRAGRICVKTSENPNWSLFLNTGLPFSTSKKISPKWFETPEYITEISCDDDSLMALDNYNRMYRIYLKKLPRERLLEWDITFGWPVQEQVILNDLVCDNRAWGISVRRSNILWYEDRYGNQHHYGTMGLATLYFLSNDGQKIYFTDSGMPVDFSNSILGPEKGSYIAENLATSGSTLFLIDKTGKMYTRLIDFDTMGCDPMFFKYTYKKENQPYTGKEYISNFTSWALPNEDWKKEPAIPLKGMARLTKFISIRQNGQGNFARSLRVAGISADGKTGFYCKNISDTEWSFKEAPLSISKKDLLPLALPKNKLTDKQKEKIQQYKGVSQEISYSGYIYDAYDNKIEDLNCYISDFTMTSEGQCSLHISNGSEIKTFLLYPIEMWTYNVRYNPGLDGTPKYYFITSNFDKSELVSNDKDFQKILENIFGEKNNVLFSFSAEVTNNYFYFTTKKDNNYSIFLSSNKDKNLELAKSKLKDYAFSPQLYKTFFTFYTYPLNKYKSNKLSLDPCKEYTGIDIPEIEQKIKNNKEYLTELNNHLKSIKKADYTTSLSRWGYNVTDLLMSVTLLNKLNFPKFKTMSTFGSELISTNASKYQVLAENLSATYPPVINLIKNRINYYQKLEEKLYTETHAKIDSSYKDDYISYFQLLNIPNKLRGYSVSAGKTCFLTQIKELPYANGFLLYFDENNIDNAVYVYMPSFLNDVSKFLHNTSKTNFKTNVKFYSLAKSNIIFSKQAGIRNINDKKGLLTWNGTNLQITVHTQLFKNELIFLY